MLTLLAHTVEPCGGAPGGSAGGPAHRADGRGRGVPDGTQPAPVQPGPHRPAVTGRRRRTAAASAAQGAALLRPHPARAALQGAEPAGQRRPEGDRRRLPAGVVLAPAVLVGLDGGEQADVAAGGLVAAQVLADRDDGGQGRPVEHRQAVLAGGLHPRGPGQEGVDDVEAHEDAVGRRRGLLRVLGVGGHRVADVDLRADPRVPGVGGVAAVERVEVRGALSVEVPPGGGQVEEHVAGVVADDLTGGGVHEGRNGGGGLVAGGLLVDLGQGAGAERRVDAGLAVGAGQLPVPVRALAVGPGHGDRLGQAEQAPGDEDAAAPRARPRRHESVAPRLHGQVAAGYESV